MSTVDPASRISSDKILANLDSSSLLDEHLDLQPALKSSGLVRYLSQAVRTALPLVVLDQLFLGTCTLAVLAIANFLAGQALLPLSLACQVTAATCFVSMFVGGLYPGVGIGGLLELRRLIMAVCVGFGLSWILLSARLELAPAANTALVVALIINAAAMPLARRIFRKFLARFDWWTQPAIVYGGGNFAASVYRSLRAQRELGLRPVGIVDDWHSQWLDEAVKPEWYLGGFSESAAIAERHGAYWGFVAIENKSSAEIEDIIDRQINTIPHLLIVAENSATCRQWSGAQSCGGIVGKRIDESLLLPGPQLLKRLIDVTLVSLCSIVFLPLLIALAIAVRISSPGKIFYGQERIGRGGKKFRAWKFRSMVVNADAVLKEYLAAHPELRAEWERDHKLKNDPRVTRVGWFLRKTSLDELPQLWNVLVGDMSLVGPRPIVDAEVKKYAAAFPLYLKVRPGITGLWQINGRNNTTYQQRVHFDMQYVRNWSPWLDGYILLNTIEVVLRCKGAY